jgi:hypothetical protein
MGNTYFLVRKRTVKRKEKKIQKRERGWGAKIFSKVSHPGHLNISH